MPKFAIVCLLLSACAASAQDASTRGNWPSYGGTSHAWRYSALDQLRADNVRRLVPAWVFQTGDYADALQATPIVIDGVMYVSTAMSWVFALDAATGKPLWEYRYPAPAMNPRYGNQNRGVAVGHGRVFVGTMDNHLVALDQKTGREVWNVDVEDANYCGCNITGAPLLVKDKIIAGVTGGDSAHRGYLTAFDVRTGRLAWRFYTIPAPGEKGNETWPGDSWRFGGGATWMTGSFDPDLNLLYWGVGNPAADFDATDRRGKNLYTGSVIALDPDTGGLKWHYQEIPQDVWDFDATYECILADLPVKGRKRKVLLHFNKGGYVWVLDRTNGEFIGAWPHVEHINWITGITETGALLGRNEPKRGRATSICPSAIGGRSWNHAAFSPKTGLLYSTALEVCQDLTAAEQDPEPGASFFGGSFVMKPPPGDRARGYIAAYDPITGKRAWTWDHPHYLLASVLATAGDLIFSGDPEGNFFALDARTGKKLWSFPTGAGHRGSPVTYTAGGRQYVATPTGWGSLIGKFFPALWPDAAPPRRGSAIFAFALPEEGR
jgi:alcohol dehydrogenase (cytochrome c)